MGDHAQDSVLPDGVLTGGGFVKQDDFGIGDKRPRECGTFLHAPGEFGGVLVALVTKFHLTNPGQSLLGNGLFVQAGCFPQGERHVFEYCHGVKQGVSLEHIAELFVKSLFLLFGHFRHGFPLEEDRTGIRFQEADDMLQQNRFSRSAFSDDDGYLALVNLQVDVVQDGVVPESFGDVSEFN